MNSTKRAKRQCSIDLKALETRITAFAKTQTKLSPAQEKKCIFEILAPLFRADGYSLTKTGWDGDDGGFTAERDSPASGTPVRVLVGYLSYPKKQRINVSEARSLIGLTGSALAGRDADERVILLTNTGFTEAARDSFSRAFPVEVELMNLDSLRNWIQRIENTKEVDMAPLVAAVTGFCQALARLVARNSRYLDNIEWRDMERLLATVFAKLGFNVELTPPAKDGGKDVVLRCLVSGEEKKYLVEVKHWCSGQRVGIGMIRKFVKVVASEVAERGLFIATYGFALTTTEALSEIERRSVVLGRESKVVSLCQTFVKAESGLWSPPTALPELLFEEPAPS